MPIIEQISLKFIFMKLLIPLLLSSFISFAQTTYKYKLTTEVDRGGRKSKTVSIAELTTVNNKNSVYEVRWVSKISYEKDTLILDSIAQKVKPYTISLSPKGSVALPKLTIPEMTGEITDLNTFFVALSPALNSQKLTVYSPVYVNNKLLHENFADGVYILQGSDCIQVTQTLLKTTGRYSVIKTEFVPPSSFCLVPLLDTIAHISFDSPNNFQMLQKAGSDKVNLLWGMESFTVVSTIDNKSRRILEATMENNLNLRMRYNASTDLRAYAAEIPFAIKRKLKLELLP